MTTGQTISDNMNENASEAPPAQKPIAQPVKSLQAKGKPGPKPKAAQPVAAGQKPIARPATPPLRADENKAERVDLRAPKKIVRRKRNTEEEDPLYIDPKMIPDGYSVEWKRISCYGKPETTYLVKLQRQGWEPAPVEQFRFLVGDEYEGKTIDIDGMRLMMRPMEYTDEARQEDHQIASEMVQSKMQQVNRTPDGQLERKVQVVRRNYERAPVTSDE